MLYRYSTCDRQHQVSGTAPHSIIPKTLLHIDYLRKTHYMVVLTAALILLLAKASK